VLACDMLHSLFTATYANQKHRLLTPFAYYHLLHRRPFPSASIGEFLCRTGKS
jgi:hypothetical protein